MSRRRVRKDGRQCRDSKPEVLGALEGKIHGALEDVLLGNAGTRYAPVDPAQYRGVSEARGLAFHSPHGCSRGAAGQHAQPGHEGWGTVTAVGRGVNAVREGDHVALLSTASLPPPSPGAGKP
jgi:hypothetical protein